MSEIRIKPEARTDFGKGASRRDRRAGRIPAVLYGRDAEPQHLTFPNLEFAAIIRNNGVNAVLTLDLPEGEQLALTKVVTIHPIRNYIEHVDLITVKRGEKVSVEVPVVLTGESAPQTLVYQDVDTILVQADALKIPEEIEISIEDLEAGSQILAGEVALPDGAELDADPEMLVVNVVEQVEIVEETDEDEAEDVETAEAGEEAPADEE